MRCHMSMHDMQTTPCAQVAIPSPKIEYSKNPVNARGTAPLTGSHGKKKKADVLIEGEGCREEEKVIG